MIVKKKDGYYVLSEKVHPDKDGLMKHRNLGGPYEKYEDAVQRLREVEYFKHHS